jgi:hypothetical protein
MTLFRRGVISSDDVSRFARAYCAFALIFYAVVIANFGTPPDSEKHTTSRLA